jgi:hypothetical protein
MAGSEPSTSAVLRNNLLLFCETATDDLIDVVRAASERASVAVACRSPDDQWVPSAFAAGAFACAAGVADLADLSLFASLIIGFL